MIPYGSPYYSPAYTPDVEYALPRMGSPFVQRRRRSHSSQLGSPLVPPKLKNLSIASSTTSLNDMYSYSSSLKNSRSLLFQDLPASVSLQQFLDCIRFGPVENCYFKDGGSDDSNGVSIVLSFVDNHTALTCYESVTDDHALAISLNAPNVKISWMLSPTMLPVVKTAIENDSATRNVYISNIPPSISEPALLAALEAFGCVETLQFHPERGAAFAHFTSIASAIKAVEQLPLDSAWSGCKVFYGRDRCILQGGGHYEAPMAPCYGWGAAAAVAASAGASNIGNRTVYLGNLHPATTVEEICNVVRGGLLQVVKYIADKHICFITFVEAAAAAQFFAASNMDGLMVHGRKLKIGWGRHSGSLPNSIALAVTGGASRNVYIGVVEETETEDVAAKKVPDLEIIRRDFSVFGEIEQINFFKDGACAFVNFLNIASAIKVVDEFNGKNRDTVHDNFEGRYRDYKISFGKDRCGNPQKAKKKKTRKPKPAAAEPPESTTTATSPAAEPLEEPTKDSGESLVFAGIGIVTNGEEPAESQYDSDTDESISIIVDKSSNSPERGDSPLSVQVPTRRWKKPSQSSTFTSRNYNSSRSSSNGSMSMYQQPYGTNSQENFYKQQRPPQQMYYAAYPMQPRTAAYMPVPPVQRQFSGVSSGSQVMAQYLAQAQHENLLYAAAVLNADEEYGISGDEFYYEEPEFDYGYYASPSSTRRSSRRK